MVEVHIQHPPIAILMLQSTMFENCPGAMPDMDANTESLLLLFAPIVVSHNYSEVLLEAS